MTRLFPKAAVSVQAVPEMPGRDVHGLGVFSGFPLLDPEGGPWLLPAVRTPQRFRPFLPKVGLLGAFFCASAAAAPRDPDAIARELDADAGHKKLYADPLARAENALTRAQAMDRAGDARHAAMMRASALEWLDAARDLVRTADAEGAAETAEKTAEDLDTKLVRGRALLEETVARRARAQQSLEQLDVKGASPVPAPSTAKPPLPAKPPPGTPTAPKAGPASPASPASPKP